MVRPERFGRISEIQIDDVSTWRDRNFLTIDIDWANNQVIADTVALVEDAGIAATWFVTHGTPMIKRLRDNPKFEIGIHPNFNFLLNGDGQGGADAAEVIDRLLELVPDARSVRSHSMAQSSQLLDLFEKRGLTHDCNHFIPNEVRIALKPWRIWNGLTRVPYFWEDDVHCMTGGLTMKELTSQPGLRVFDFHPIHVFLNTESLDRYEAVRPILADSAALLHHRSSARCGGARDMLEQLLESR